MLIDHIGATFLKYGTSEYIACRIIGRLSFPIFCFLIEEGFSYTRNNKKYLLRLLIFAIISEIPFDLLFFNKLIYINYQNVFFTLFLGLLNINLLKKINEKNKIIKNNNKKINNLIKIIFNLFLIFIFCLISYLLKTDYNYYGILLINIYYLFKNKKILKNIFSYILIFLNNIKSLIYFIDIILFNFYSREKGKNINKYLFYIFYPAHLIILYIIKLFIF